MLNPLEFIERLKQTPNMFLRPVNFETVSSCMLGFDLAYDGEVFGDKFHEWLTKKVDSGHNFAWPGLILKIAFPKAENLRDCIVDLETDQHAVTVLLDLASSFLNETSATK